MSSKQIKKDLRRQVADKLTTTFETLNKDISPKKLQRNIRKASKALLSGLKVKPGKQIAVKTKKVKKVTVEK